MSSPLISPEQCQSKLWFKSKADAKIQAKRSSTRYGGRPILAFLCPVCSRPGQPTYHLGHRPAALRKGSPSR